MKTSTIIKITAIAVFAILATVLLVSFINKYSNQSHAAQPIVNITMNPKTGTLSGDTQVVTLYIQPVDSSSTISGIHLKLLASGSTYIVGVQDPRFINSPTVGTTKLFNTNQGTSADFSYNAPYQTLPQGGWQVDVMLKGTSAGTGTLKVVTAGSQVVGGITGYVYDFGTVDDGNFTFTSGGGGTGNTNINLKLKFQGITALPRNNGMKVKVTVASLNGGTPITQLVDFTADASGIWSGKMNFDLPPGDGPSFSYSIYIKGPRHLQKRVCDPNPKESTPATYRCLDAKDHITLHVGDNSFDFSTIYQLGGDLPVDNGQQNSLIDSADTGYIRNNFGATDPSILAVGDINQDGQIDSQDFSLIIAALGVKYDDPGP